MPIRMDFGGLYGHTSPQADSRTLIPKFKLFDIGSYCYQSLNCGDCATSAASMNHFVPILMATSRVAVMYNSHEKAKYWILMERTKEMQHRYLNGFLPNKRKYAFLVPSGKIINR